MIICSFKYKLCSERVNPFTFNVYLNIRCLPLLTILFQENMNMNTFNLAHNYRLINPHPLACNGLGNVSHCQLTY